MEGIDFKSINAMDYWASQFYLYLPKLGLGLLVLIVGVLASKAAGGMVARLLKKIGFDTATQKTGITDIAKVAGIQQSISDAIGDLVKYAGYLMALMLSFDIFGMQVITGVLGTIISYIPRLIGSVAILVVGFITASVIAEVIKHGLQSAGADDVAKKVGMNISLGEIAETLVRYFLYIAVVLISLGTLGISAEVLTWLFTTAAAAIVLTGALILVISLRDIGPSIATGVFIKSEKALKKGDRITVKGHTGEVIQVGLVYTTVKTKKGTVEIPNKTLANEEFERQ